MTILTILPIVYGITGLTLGAILTFVLVQVVVKGKSRKILGEAEAEAEVIRKDKILQAKEKFLQLKSDHEKMINERTNKLVQDENRFNQKESSLSHKIEENHRERKEVEVIRNNLKAQMEVLDRKEDDLAKMHKQQVEQLESISGLSAVDAKEQLIDSLREEAKTEAMSYVNEIMDEARLTANKEAKRVIVNSIQRVASETAIENAVTVSILNQMKLRAGLLAVKEEISGHSKLPQE